MNCNRLIKALVVTTPFMFSSISTRADTQGEIAIGVFNTMNRFYDQHSGNRELVRKAAGILVFPRVTKAGFGVAGEHGEGALLVGGRPVAYYSIGAGSIGATVGAGQHSEVLLFMTKEALANFRRSQGWTVGADAQVAVVSTGAGGQYESATLSKPILAFLFSEKGLLGDLSIEGARIAEKSS